MQPLQQLEFANAAHALLAVPQVAIGADSRHPAAAPIVAQHAIAELAAHEPGRAAPALSAHRMGLAAITGRLEQLEGATCCNRAGSNTIVPCPPASRNDCRRSLAVCFASITVNSSK